MPRMPLRELRPEIFEDEYQTDSDDNVNDFDRSSGEMRKYELFKLDSKTDHASY